MKATDNRTVFYGPNAARPKTVGRKPRGWVSRFQLILLPTQHPNGDMVNRWHIVKHYGKEYGCGSRGHIYPHPGDDIDNEILVRRAGLTDVTVPVEIIRPSK